MDKPPIQRVDDALCQYYKDLGRNDYFDESGMGKFRKCLDKTGAKESDVTDAFGENANSSNHSFFENIDHAFPLLLSTNESRGNEIFHILKHCYKYGHPPFLGISGAESSFVQQIASALNHELYDKISSTFMVVVNENKTFQNMNDLLEAIQNKRGIHPDELNYIGQLIQRAKQFHDSNHSETRKVADQQMMIDMDDMGPNSDGFTFNLLVDIYNVHKCFLFGNDHFKHYDVKHFAA
eukprot:434246_1